MRSLNLLVLRCRDLERSRAFYEIFGFAFARHQHGKGPEHLAHEDDSGVFELYPSTLADSTESTGLGFGVADLPALWKIFSDRGASPGPVKENAWGRTFVVRDPDGRRVEVKQIMAAV